VSFTSEARAAGAAWKIHSDMLPDMAKRPGQYDMDGQSYRRGTPCDPVAST
jgi:hypothetical protein